MENWDHGLDSALLPYTSDTSSSRDTGPITQPLSRTTVSLPMSALTERGIAFDPAETTAVLTADGRLQFLFGDFSRLVFEVNDDKTSLLDDLRPGFVDDPAELVRRLTDKSPAPEFKIELVELPGNDAATVDDAEPVDDADPGNDEDPAVDADLAQAQGRAASEDDRKSSEDDNPADDADPDRSGSNDHAWLSDIAFAFNTAASDPDDLTAAPDIIAPDLGLEIRDEPADPEPEASPTEFFIRTEFGDLGEGGRGPDTAADDALSFSLSQSFSGGVGTGFKSAHPPDVTVGDATVMESGAVVFSVGLSSPAPAALTLDLLATGASAKAGSAFEITDLRYSADGGATWINAGGANGTEISFTPGRTSLLVEIDTADSIVLAGDETFNLAINNVVAGAVGDISATATSAFLYPPREPLFSDSFDAPRLENAPPARAAGDTFVWQAEDMAGDTKPVTGSAAADDGDVLDIVGLMLADDKTNLSDLISLRTVAADTHILTDQDGNSAEFTTDALEVLQNVTGLDLMQLQKIGKSAR